MIKSYGSKETEKIWEGEISPNCQRIFKKLPGES
jgi:hypothetical protein